MRKPYAIDLFAGIGGMSLGFEQAGFDVLVAVEMNPALAKIHATNFPETRVVTASVRELDGSRLLEECRAALESRGEKAQTWDGKIEVLFGGPPCQSASLAGRRVLSDPRNELMHEMSRLAAELRPKFVVVENVVGMTIGQHREIPLELMRTLNSHGYRTNVDGSNFSASILNAADFGTPQDRRRMFIVARLGTETPLLPRPQGVRTAKRSNVPGFAFDSKGPSVSDAFEGLPGPLESGDKLCLDTEEIIGTYARTLHGLEVDATDKSRFRGKQPDEVDGFSRTVHEPEVIERFARTRPGSVERVSRFYRLDQDGLAPTMRAGTDSLRGNHTAPRPIHPTQHRVITVREAARLHGYPDAFTFGGTIWMGLRGIGNSVPPPLARAVATSLLKQSETEATVKFQS